MNKIKILHMYADMLDLYGDSGNMEILKYRCSKRNIECIIDKYSIDDDMPYFPEYDLIYIGGGADLEQQHISADLLKCRDGIKKAYKNGSFLFLICGGLWGLYGVSLLGAAVLFNICATEDYGFPYTAPVSPFTFSAMRDIVTRVGFRKMQHGNFTVEKLNRK